jgi:hypothetical protein
MKSPRHHGVGSGYLFMPNSVAVDTVLAVNAA